MTNGDALSRLAAGKLSVWELRSLLVRKDAETERLRQQRDAANSQISFLLEMLGGEDVHKN